LRANEGRETNALNCKPNTNLKEKYELSNYCKTSGFLLHAVRRWQFTQGFVLHFTISAGQKSSVSLTIGSLHVEFIESLK
jgi:hypothetical protein